jgi:hypothetical protein
MPAIVGSKVLVMPAITVLSDADTFYAVQGGVDKQIPFGTVKAAILASVPSSTGATGLTAVTTRGGMAAITTPAANSAVLLMEGDRAGIFVFRAGDQSGKVSIDPQQGLYVAPAAATSGTSGAWERRTDKAGVNVRWFGATGDGVTNDSAAFVAAIAYLKAIAANAISSFYKASQSLFIPAGHYFMGATTLEITHQFAMIGEPSAMGQPNHSMATKMRWGLGATGIRIQRYNTSGVSTIDGVTHFGGDGLVLENLELTGPASLLTAIAEGEYGLSRRRHLLRR